MARADELRAILAHSVGAEPAAQAFLRGILEPTAKLEAYLDLKTERTLEILLDPAACPDEVVEHLAATVGLGPDLPAAYSLSLEQRRSLASVAISLWKRLGTIRSWRDVLAFLTGRRAMIFDWFHHRIILGSSLEIHMVPVPSTAPGGAYDNPEFVTDVWVMDPSGTGKELGELEAVVTRWLAVVLPANERINVYPAVFVENLLQGANLWTIEVPGNPGDGYRDDLALADGSTVGIVATADNTFIVPDDIDITPNFSVGLRHTWWIAHDVAGELLFFAQDDLAADAYGLSITNDAGSYSATAALRKYVAGVPTLLATFTLPQILVESWPYRWTIDVVRPISGDSEIRVWWEGVLLGEYVDPDASDPYRDGRPGFRAGALAGRRSVLQGMLVYRHEPTRTRVGLDP